MPMHRSQPLWNVNDFNSLDLAQWGVPEIPLVGIHGHVFAKRPLNPHRHEGLLEVSYIGDGEGEYRVGGKDFHLRKGDVIVTYPPDFHSTGLLRHGLRLYWLQVALPERGRAGFLGLDGASARGLVGALWSFPRRHFRGEAYFRRTVQDIFAECRAGRSPLQPLRLRALASGLLLACLEWSGRGETGGEGELSPEIARLVRRLREQPQENLSAPQMAEYCGLSVSRFKAKFRQQTGAPPGDFLLRLKVEEGKRLLSQSGGSVTDIAFHLGFSSSQYFSTVFRRFLNVSPGEFRRRRRDKS